MLKKNTSFFCKTIYICKTFVSLMRFNFLLDESVMINVLKTKTSVNIQYNYDIISFLVYNSWKNTSDL